MSPDWSVTVEPVPYAKLNNPRSLDLYVYALDSPTSIVDPDGHSWLLYDGSTHTVTLISKSGAVVGSWTAYNNVAFHNGRQEVTSGPIPNGLYPVLDHRGAWKHLGDSSNGPYGPGGDIRLAPYRGLLGNTVHGGALHAGRAHVKDALLREGPQHCTLACVRTTDTAMATINNWAETDPLQFEWVTHNGPNATSWLKSLHLQQNYEFHPVEPQVPTTLIPLPDSWPGASGAL